MTSASRPQTRRMRSATKREIATNWWTPAAVRRSQRRSHAATGGIRTRAAFAFASSGTGVLPRSWQPFPAASARGGPGPLPPVGEQVLQGALEGDLHLPAGRLLDLRRVPFEDHDVGRPQPARIRLDLDVSDAGLLEQEVQHLLDRPRPPRAQVVHFPRLAPLQERPVAADDVPDVGIVAPGREVAHQDTG